MSTRYVLANRIEAVRMSESRIRLLITAALVAFVVYVVIDQAHPFGTTRTPEDLAGPDVEIGETVRLSGVVTEPGVGSRDIIVGPEHASEPTVYVQLRDTVAFVPSVGTHVLVEGMVVKPGELEGAVLIRPSPPHKYTTPQPAR